MALKLSTKQPLIAKSLFKLTWLRLVLVSSIGIFKTLYKPNNYINYVICFNKNMFYNSKYMYNYLIRYKKCVYYNYKSKPAFKFLNNNVISLL